MAAAMKRLKVLGSGLVFIFFSPFSPNKLGIPGAKVSTFDGHLNHYLT
jgi:hypothetical protein